MSNDTPEAVRRALRIFANADDDTDLDDDVLRPLIAEHGWTSVRDSVLTILEGEYPELWRDATAAVWELAHDGREMLDDRTIALVYHRLPSNAPEHDANLAWSIASKLKGVGYLSDYEPANDPGVAAETAKLRTSN